MRSSALAGFLASAVFVSGSAGFASTFLVGPYLGEHVRHQPSRATLMSSAAPVDPLTALQIPGTSVIAHLEGEPPASQRAHRLRNVENTASPVVTTVQVPATPASDASPVEDVPAVTEEAFAPTAPSVIPASSGGPLIATETTSAMVSSKLENGEPVLTLRVAPVVAAATPAVDSTDPDNAVEPTIISAPPSEQALAAPTVALAPAPAVRPPSPPVEPRAKPALRQAAPAPAEPPRRARTRTTTPARVTTTAEPTPAPIQLGAPPGELAAPAAPPTPDPLNAPYTPANSPTLGGEEPAAPPEAPPASGQPQTTGGPTPLVMPQ